MRERGAYQRRVEVAGALSSLAAQDPLRVVVRGDSMRGCLKDGDEVCVAPRRLYWPGDVLVLHGEKDQIIVHRLVGYRPTRNGWRMVTKGDAVRSFDAPVARASVIGRVTAGFGPDGEPKEIRGRRFWSICLFLTGGLQALFRRAGRRG